MAHPSSNRPRKPPMRLLAGSLTALAGLLAGVIVLAAPASGRGHGAPRSLAADLAARAANGHGNGKGHGNGRGRGHGKGGGHGNGGGNAKGHGHGKAGGHAKGRGHKRHPKHRYVGTPAGINLLSLDPSEMARVKKLGVHWVRVFARWEDLEPSRGKLANNWFEMYERLLKARPKGTNVIIDFVGSPTWESGSSNPNAAPANPAEYAAILHTLAERLKGRVAAYEIWNEEDAPAWWSPNPEPAAYTALLKAAYPAVKSADPKAKVVLGGLTGNDYHFLEGVYAAGGKGYFDAIGVHTDTACDIHPPSFYNREPDERIGPDSFIAYREIHALELRHGDHSPIWMTELSWRTTPETCGEGAMAGKGPEGVSEGTQAEYLYQAYHCLRESPYVKVGLWFAMADQEPNADSGLLRANGTPKASWKAMRTYAHRGDHLKGPCGDFKGPSITVTKPKPHTEYGKDLEIAVSATDPQGVDRVHFEVEGHEVRNFDNPVQHPKVLSGHFDWAGADNLSYGHHLLVITATDYIHNNTVVKVPFVHVHKSKGG